MLKKVIQKNKLDQQLYLNKLYEQVEMGNGLKDLEKNNKSFQKLLEWLRSELERTKNGMLKCKIEELSQAREYARGNAVILRQIEIFKKTAEIANQKLKDLNK